MTEIMQLLPPYFDYHWPYIEKEMLRCQERWESWTTPDNFYSMVQSRMVQVWAAGNAEAHQLIVVTQVVCFPYKRLQVLFAMGNHLREHIETLNAVLEKFAIMQECIEAEIFGRRGFERFLAKFGFKPRSVVLVKKIEARSVH